MKLLKDGGTVQAGPGGDDSAAQEGTLRHFSGKRLMILRIYYLETSVSRLSSKLVFFETYENKTEQMFFPNRNKENNRPKCFRIGGDATFLRRTPESHGQLRCARRGCL